MKFHKEGIPSLIVAIAVLAIMYFIGNFVFPQSPIIKGLLNAVGVIFLIVIVQFFRNPNRKRTFNDNLIICPADGKVVVIEETIETEYFKDKRIQVSIFMSPVNVHINRFPISGIVKYVKYHAGLYLVAWHPKSSTDNERTTVVVEHKNGQAILFRQVAGALARRIVWYCKEGDVAQQNDEFGFIKFGSRVDVYLPLGTTINVTMNQVVKGGVDVLGKWA
ncbi:MAG: phosphatidylserine decarboxylase family protein [Bacteroidia bacterium]|nr:phosphatidylserine decarboxylase family protein [Bacteroidia bacterium]